MTTAGAVAHVRIQSEDLWNEALKKVQFTNTSALVAAGLDRRQILVEILELVQKQELKAQERKWKWKKKNGQVIIIRDIFVKLAIWMEKFKSVGDILVQYDPIHASLPWAVVRFLLQAAVSDIQSNGAILEGMEIVVNLLARCEIVEYLHLQKVSRATALLADAIVKLYTDILDYLFQAHAYFEPHILKKIANSFFLPEESTHKFISSIRQNESEVEKYTRLVSDESLGEINRNMNGLTHSMDVCQTSIQSLQKGISSTKLLGNDLGQRLERLHKLTQTIQQDTSSAEIGRTKLEHHLANALNDLKDPVQRIAEDISSVQDNLKEKERVKVFEWLTMIPSSSHHREKLRNLLSGSCNWLLRKKEFKEWMEASISSILWLHGIPGSGKSMLVCHVIEYLRTRAIQHHSSAPIAYFYCSRTINEPERADPSEILRNILEQLCSLDAETPIREPVSKEYLARRKEARGRTPEKLSLGETVDIISELLESNPATIVVDGLDECDPIKRNDLLLGLQKIITNSNNIVKVFVSSRDDHDLVHHLARSPNLYIHATDNTGDIKMFIKSRIKEAIREDKLLCGRVSSCLKKIIIGKLIKKANGMFRLASMHIDSLCDPYRVKTEANVHYALDHLPQELGKSYDVVISQIMQAEYPNPLLASRALKWLLCSREALNSKTLPQAIFVNNAGHPLLSNDEILSICFNLVVYNKEMDKFQFAHLSVREHLESQPGYSAEDTNLMAAEACLSFIISESQDPPEFRNHAVSFWGNYAKLAPSARREGILGELLAEFLLSPFESNISGRARLRGYLYKHEYMLEISQLLECTNAFLLWTVFLACKHDLSEIVRRLLSLADCEHTFTAKSFMGLNCVQTSSYFDSPMTINLLHDITTSLLPKKFNHDLYWSSAYYVASHRGSRRAAQIISEIRTKEKKLCTRPRKCCVKPIVNHSVIGSLLASQCSPETQPREVMRPTSLLMLQNNDADIVLTLFKSFDECFGLCNECTFSILRPLDMVSLSLANAFAPLNAVENDTPSAKQTKITAMAKIISDIMKIPSKTMTGAREVSWVTSIIAFGMISGHEIYDRDIFMHHLTEAFLYMSLHENKSTDGHNMTWNSHYRALLRSVMRIRNVVNEQKFMYWDVVLLARGLYCGRDALLVLLRVRTKIAPNLINLALSTWDREMVKALLEYNSIKIDNEVIRFVAGNVKHGKAIMEMLLAREMEREMSETVHETALETTLESAQ
ncbi:putative ankyrin repeat protein [Botrytis fragariae]|uniref:Putative ankyrin repeat protein n=1 Tax=Botrytis fragariae TaxID=1964551 RepID=A0A8H6EM62_9HELO|nr:putative ankyrin repeat protein [Botrytis fragariae]KAF5876990.1 putative ankyrin repeat protein [Botrytis fragariae]